MEAQIQETLDSQWDALESRDKRIIKIRERFGNLLNELAIQKNNELSKLSLEITSQGSAINEARRAASQRDELNRSIEELQQSEVARKLETLNTQILTIDKDIEKLVAQKEQLMDEKTDLESIYSSRSAKFITAIADIESKYKRQIEQLPKRCRVMEKMETTKNNIYNELVAAKNGGILWEKVFNTLTELDIGLKECGKNQLPQISFMLTKAIKDIEQDLHVAVESKWSALSIAIGHELKLLQDTLSAVKEYDKNEE